MKWSVLDQSPVAEGKTQDVSIGESPAPARLCDALGYHRYWVSERHNSDGIVGTAPGILMAAITATTRRIRVGSAGVVLPRAARHRFPRHVGQDLPDAPAKWLHVLTHAH
jgi:alkanesulfonate monooxygenase SsuD/methylene tetrahydromethanopterin reductase-like flavin-dependent oxidoreductase (luciferase family)